MPVTTTDPEEPGPVGVGEEPLPPFPPPSEAAWPAPIDEALTALLPEDDPRSPRVLVSLLELNAAETEAAVAEIAAEAEAAGEFPVFITDRIDFSVFTRSGHFYEYLPPVADQTQHAPGQRWDAYIANKVQTMIAKWEPAEVIARGLSVEEFIRRVREAHGLE